MFKQLFVTIPAAGVQVRVPFVKEPSQVLLIESFTVMAGDGVNPIFIQQALPLVVAPPFILAVLQTGAIGDAPAMFSDPDRIAGVQLFPGFQVSDQVSPGVVDYYMEREAIAIFNPKEVVDGPFDVILSCAYGNMVGSVNITVLIEYDLVTRSEADQAVKAWL